MSWIDSIAAPFKKLFKQFQPLFRKKISNCLAILSLNFSKILSNFQPHSKIQLLIKNTKCTHQLSKLLLISKRSPKEWDTIEMNNILKFQQNSWTINRHHIKFKFSFKLGLGFSWLMQRVGPLPPQQHMAEKHQQITAKSILGKTKVERVDFALPHNLTLPIFYLCCPLLESTKPYSS